MAQFFAPPSGAQPMGKPIWDGKGDAEGMVYFTKNNGDVVGRPYVRQRVLNAFSVYWRQLSLAKRHKAVAMTIDDDLWLRVRNGQTVTSLIRDAEEVLWW